MRHPHSLIFFAGLLLVPTLEASLFGSWPIGGQSLMLFPLVILCLVALVPATNAVTLSLVAALWRDAVLVLLPGTSLVATLCLLSAVVGVRYALTNSSLLADLVVALVGFAAYVLGLIVMAWIGGRAGANSPVSLPAVAAVGVSVALALVTIGIMRRIRGFVFPLGV